MRMSWMRSVPCLKADCLLLAVLCPLELPKIFRTNNGSWIGPPRGDTALKLHLNYLSWSRRWRRSYIGFVQNC